MLRPAVSHGNIAGQHIVHVWGLCPVARRLHLVCASRSLSHSSDAELVRRNGKFQPREKSPSYRLRNLRVKDRMFQRSVTHILRRLESARVLREFLSKLISLGERKVPFVEGAFSVAKMDQTKEDTFVTPKAVLHCSLQLFQMFGVSTTTWCPNCHAT